MSDHGGGNAIPYGAKRFILAAAIFVVLAFLHESNSKVLKFIPGDLFTRDEIRLTTNTKLSGDKYAVERVVDGDTVVIDYHGVSEKIRLIGINTPETVDPRKPVECFGKEASNKMKSLLEGKSVYIETDASQGERDKYNRLLAYLYLEDGQMINRKMIAEGYAYEYTYMHPYKYQQDFKEALAFARNSKQGLWADGMCSKESINH